MDCSLQHSSVHGIFQARVLEWVAISFSRGSFQPRDQTWLSHIVGRCFTIWATKEVTFHAKVGTIKDRNGVDLTEAEDIKKRWQEYTELYKRDLHDPGNRNGVITHLEPDLLECKIKWALGSITINKASGDDGIPAEPFQIIKDDDMKVLHLICQQIWKTQQWPED